MLFLIFLKGISNLLYKVLAAYDCNDNGNCTYGNKDSSESNYNYFTCNIECNKGNGRKEDQNNYFDEFGYQRGSWDSFPV